MKFTQIRALVSTVALCVCLPAQPGTSPSKRTSSPIDDLMQDCDYSRKFDCACVRSELEKSTNVYKALKSAQARCPDVEAIRIMRTKECEQSVHFLKKIKPTGLDPANVCSCVGDGVANFYDTHRDPGAEQFKPGGDATLAFSVVLPACLKNVTAPASEVRPLGVDLRGIWSFELRGHPGTAEITLYSPSRLGKGNEVVRETFSGKVRKASSGPRDLDFPIFLSINISDQRSYAVFQGAGRPMSCPVTSIIENEVQLSCRYRVKGSRDEVDEAVLLKR